MAILRRLHAPGAADLHRRGVPGRHRVAGAVRRRRDDRPDDQGAVRDEVRLTASVGGGGDEAGRQDRVGPAQAGRARGGAAGRGGGVPGAAADLAPVGRRREDGRSCCASSGCRRSATSLRSRPMPSSGGSASTARRWWTGRTGSTRTRWRRGSPRSRSGTSTRSGTTRRIGRGDRADAAGHGRRGRVAAAGGGAAGGDDHAQAARLVVHDDHPPDDAGRAGGPDGADLRGGAGAAAAGAARAADPAGGGDRVQVPRPRAARRCSRPPRIRSGTRRRRRWTRSGASTASGR